MPGRYGHRFASALLLLAAGACDNPPVGILDRAPPTLTLYSPASAALVETDSVVVQGLAEDPQGVRRVSYRLNDGAEEEVAIQPSNAVFFAFVLRELRLGANELEVLTHDATGQVSAQKVGFTTRDVRAPVVEVQSVREGDVVGRDSVRVAGVARDGIQVASLAYSLDGGAEQGVQITPGRQAGFAFTLKGTAPGEHVLALRARDQAGNAATQTLRFSVAGIGVEITSPARDTTIGRFALLVRGRVETDVPLSKLTASIDGGAEVPLCQSYRYSPYCDFESAGTHAFAVTVDNLANGRAALAIHAYDRQGMKVGAATRTLTVSVPVKQYDLAYLGTLGWGDSWGAELNEKNQVAGRTLTPTGASRAFVWDGTRMLDLGGELGTASWASAINESGEVVGTFTADCQRAFHYRIGQQGGPRALVEGCGYYATDVNDAGKALLHRSGIESPRGDAFLLEDGRLVRLQRGDHSVQAAMQVNNRDQVLGLLYQSSQPAVPAWLSPTAAPAQLGTDYTSDLNDRGHLAFLVPGPLGTPFGESSGYVVTDRRRDVASPGPYPASPRALNNRDQAAGIYFRGLRWAGAASTLVPGVFFWESGVTYSVEIADADWEIDVVSDMNDAGVILAHGRNVKTGQSGAVLLLPRG